MSNEALHPPHLFEGLHMELQGLLSPDPRTLAYEDDIELPMPWVKIGEIDPYKAKAIHTGHKLFVKSFSPRTLGYADAYFEAMQELSSVPFQIPILPVVGKSGGSLFFQQGIDRGVFRWQYFDEEERAAMTEIVKKHGLYPLGMFNKLPIIEVEGNQYLADPIEDTIVSVDDFLEKQRGAARH